MKHIIALLVCWSILIAREDPFEPSITPKEGQHNQREPKKEFLQDIEIALPSTARVLQKVSITYQNIDGTIATKELQIHQNIDWHYPLELAQKAIGKKYTGEKRLRFGDFELKIQSLLLPNTQMCDTLFCQTLTALFWILKVWIRLSIKHKS